MTVKTLLLVRGVFNALFGLTLVAWMQLHTLHGLNRGGVYALVDGILGLALAIAILPHRRHWAFGLTLADALVRILLGVVILRSRGLLQMPVGSALFFSAAIFLCIALGVAGLVAVYVQRRANALQTRENLMTGTMLVMSVSTLLLGVCLGLRFLEDQERLTLALYCIAVGLAYCWAGYRMRGSITRVD